MNKPPLLAFSDSTALGKQLQSARKALKLTQSDVAIAAGVGLRFMVELESGKPSVRLEQVIRVIQSLGGQLCLKDLPQLPPPRAKRSYRRRLPVLPAQQIDAPAPAQPDEFE